MISVKFFSVAGLTVAMAASTFLMLNTDAASSEADTMSTGESRAYLHSYSLPSSGIAIEGYCPVAYFAADKAVRGKPMFASTHNNVTYHFVSADAKEAFDANPTKYIPAFGGWCAFGMAVEDKFPVNPRLFKIVDGQLLLFLGNKGVDAQQLWNDSDEKELLRKARAHWSTVQG